MCDANVIACCESYDSSGSYMRGKIQVVRDDKTVRRPGIRGRESIIVHVQLLKRGRGRASDSEFSSHERESILSVQSQDI